MSLLMPALMICRLTFIYHLDLDIFANISSKGINRVVFLKEWWHLNHNGSLCCQQCTLLRLFVGMPYLILAHQGWYNIVLLIGKQMIWCHQKILLAFNSSFFPNVMLPFRFFFFKILNQSCVCSFTLDKSNYRFIRFCQSLSLDSK